jgi:plastocyanin
VYLGFDVTGTKVGWSLMDFHPATLTIAAGDSIIFETRGYGHLLLFSPSAVAFFDGPTLTYVPPTYAGTNQITDPTAVYSGGPTWAGDSFTFTFPNQGTFNAFCGYHPGMRFSVVVAATASATPAQVDTARTASIDSAIAALPVKSITGTAPSVQNANGFRTHTVTVGGSSFVPKAAFHKFIPSNIVIMEGDSVKFVVDDHIDVRPLAINSSGFFKPTNPLVGGTVLETVATAPGGRMIEQPFYLQKTGDNTNYNTGFISSGWMGAPDFPELPGFGKLASEWTVTFNTPGTFPLIDAVGAYCPSYTGISCVPLMKGSIRVDAEPEPEPEPNPNPIDDDDDDDDDSANAVILSMWAMLAMFLAYF